MKDKVLLVTGASSDVGCALVKNVADKYSKILVHYHSGNELIGELIKQFGEKIVPLQADFSNQADIEKMLETIKDLGVMPDHIVHLPAIKAYNSNFHKDNIENLEKMFKVSVESISRILQKCIPYMSKQKYGKIIFMLSSYVEEPVSYQAFYITTKHALLGLMKSLSVEYASKNIQVNAVSPSMIETKFLSDIPELIIQDNAQKNPAGRNLTVDDIIPVFADLLDDEKGYVSGKNICVTTGIN